MENKETLEEVAKRLSKDAYKKHSVKDSTFSLDEQIQRCGGFIVGFKEGFKESAKWQREQDKNKYSEEEVLELFKKYQYDLAQWVLRMENDIDGKPVPTEWFEKFKKK